MNSVYNIKKSIKKKKLSESKEGNKLLFSFLIKTLILIILMLLSLIFIKSGKSNKELFYNFAFRENISFVSIKNFYNKYFGDIFPIDSGLDIPVFKEELEYSDINKYKDGVVLTVSNKYLVPSGISGIVTFIGEKEGYGKTLIIEGEDYKIWYANLDTISVNLYDYIDKGIFIGDTIDDKLYILYEKEGEFLDYKEYM